MAASLYKRATEMRDLENSAYNTPAKGNLKAMRSRNSSGTTLETMQTSNGATAVLNKSHITLVKGVH
jgi:hypothetical protein